MHTQPRITDMFKIANAPASVVVRPMPTTPGSAGRKSRGASVHLTPWSFKKKQHHQQQSPLTPTAAAASRRKRPLLATSVGDEHQQQQCPDGASASSKRICASADGVVELLKDEEAENAENRWPPLVQQPAEPVATDLVALDTLLEQQGHNQQPQPEQQRPAEAVQKAAKKERCTAKKGGKACGCSATCRPRISPSLLRRNESAEETELAQRRICAMARLSQGQMASAATGADHCVQ
ncbi:hypothetical protein niasHT_000506 [Heterodera trifolii]|uniref:Uncharacterized protein n=1 Tax=Heterodera trifolii TaxID=157864 RepID=A0ABD2LU24_9BILA